jgi:hypothetical protein
MMSIIGTQQVQSITNPSQMASLKSDEIFPNLNKLEMCCLYEALKNESGRWCSIIDSESASCEDYEYEMIKLDSLIDFFEQKIKSDTAPNEISFDQKQTELLIEAIDNEYNSYIKEKSLEKKESDEKECVVIEQTRTKLREVAICTYGPRILELAHYKSDI